MRSTLDAEPKPPATSLARRWLARYLVLASLQSAAMRLVMPMAVSTSALRRLASASDCAGHGEAGRGPRRLARHDLGHHGDDAEDDGADQRGQPDIGMEQKADRRDRPAATADRTARSGPSPTGTIGCCRDRAAAAARRCGCRPSAAAARWSRRRARSAPRRDGCRCAPGCGRGSGRAGPAPHRARPARITSPTSVGTLRLGSTRS